VSVIDRLSAVVKSEWGHRFRRKPKDDAAEPDTTTTTTTAATTAGAAPKKRAVIDVQGALRVLDLTGTPTLADVRARYAELARRYHPKTQSPRDDEAHAARVVLEALTDALEILEEHLLPLS
jgi:hypothetical protein